MQDVVQWQEPAQAVLRSPALQPFVSAAMHPEFRAFLKAFFGSSQQTWKTVRYLQLLDHLRDTLPLTTEYQLFGALDHLVRQGTGWQPTSDRPALAWRTVRKEEWDRWEDEGKERYQTDPQVRLFMNVAAHPEFQDFFRQHFATSEDTRHSVILLHHIHFLHRRWQEEAQHDISHDELLAAVRHLLMEPQMRQYLARLANQPWQWAGEEGLLALKERTEEEEETEALVRKETDGRPSCGSL